MTIYLLLAVGVLLVGLNAKAIRKEGNSFNKILIEKQYDITDVEVSLGELRREFSETILELQKEIISLEEEIESLKDKENTKITEVKDNTKALVQNIRYNDSENIISNSDPELLKAPQVFKKESIIEETPKIKDSSNNVKINEIGDMIEKGMAIEEICDNLKIGKGEVLLIKELYLK